MANEWTKVELLGPNRDGEVRRFEVANTTNASQGQLMQLADPRTVSATVTLGAAVAGLAATEKVAGDGETSLGCWTQGIFEATASEATAIQGEIGMAGVANKFSPMSAVSGGVIGYALETASVDELVNVRLDL